MYGGYDVKALELLGEGTQGKVYKIDSFKCIKIFKSKSVCQKEIETLIMAQKDPHFSCLYGAGENYIIREYIDGIELDKYLKVNPLSLEISYKLIEIYEALGRVGFLRQDLVLFHIFITKQGDFKVIDTARAMRKKTIYPKLMLSGLKKLGYKEQFLKDVEAIKPEIYRNWKNK